jgi:hypothetical protein
MIESGNESRKLHLKPLAACLAFALSVGATTTELSAASPTGAVPASEVLRNHSIRRTGDGFLRIQQERLNQGRAKAQARVIPPRPAGTVIVTSCADDGSTGTLRSAVESAVDGDVIDLSALTCSTITLAAGGIGVAVDSLSVIGPGASALTVDASAGGTTFDFFGTNGYGTLEISGLTLTNGLYQDVGGGGLWTGDGGSLVLTDVAVTNSTSVGKYASGGGIFSSGNVTLTNSTVSGNVAASSKYDGIGAGVYAAGNLTIVNSTISGNTASADDSYDPGYGPGVGAGGGVAATGTTSIINSTISGNSASFGGGVFAQVLGTLQNSTITLNTASPGNSSDGVSAGGGGVAAAGSLALNSSILFGNTGSSAAYGADIGGGITVTGANNLVGSSTVALPADTLASDPLLQPLAANGGPTQTHALATGSPAINAGSNPAALATDQRGPGFARVSGTAADIGAFEVQLAGPDPDPEPAVRVELPTLSSWALGMLIALLGVFGWHRSLPAGNRRK